MDESRISMNFSWDERVADLLRTAIRKKLATYTPETTNMPFHTLLLKIEWHFIHLYNRLIPISGQPFLSYRHSFIRRTI